MALIDLVDNIKKISIIGLAKNTGKTIVLQKLVDELYSHKIATGVTSIGHDGEEFDQTNNLIKKPRIFLREDTLVATTEKLFNETSAKFDLLKETNHKTPLGKVCIGVIKKGGIIEVAGPSTARAVNDVAELMLKLGASKVLIDGAINRKAISAPEYTNGVIVSTGAVLHDEFEQLIKESVKIISSFKIPSFNEKPAFNILLNGTIFFDKNGKYIRNYENTLLLNNNLTKILTDDNIAIIYTDRSLTELFLDNITDVIKKRNNKKLIIVIKDHTKLFMYKKSLQYYEKNGIMIRVQNPTNLIAVTVNPVSPLSHSFNSHLMVSALKSNFIGLPVFDVLAPDYN